MKRRPGDDFAVVPLAAVLLVVVVLAVWALSYGFFGAVESSAVYRDFRPQPVERSQP